MIDQRGEPEFPPSLSKSPKREEAVALACKHKRTELESDRVLVQALVKLVEIVGVAAGRVSRTSQAAHP